MQHLNSCVIRDGDWLYDCVVEEEFIENGSVRVIGWSSGSCRHDASPPAAFESLSQSPNILSRNIQLFLLSTGWFLVVNSNIDVEPVLILGILFLTPMERRQLTGRQCAVCTISTGLNGPDVSFLKTHNCCPQQYPLILLTYYYSYFNLNFFLSATIPKYSFSLHPMSF